MVRLSRHFCASPHLVQVCGVCVCVCVYVCVYVYVCVCNNEPLRISSKAYIISTVPH